MEDHSVDMEQVLPWHHVQLYNFMGKDADYFLHPKLDVEQPVEATSTTPLRNKTAYSSVDGLWSALRKESTKKLVRIDRNASQELKATYRAYIREYMKGLDSDDQERNIVGSSKLVPEIEKLLDDSRLNKITERRRKTQVMFRSSMKNEDRTKILLYNNPMPDMNNHSGEEGIMRFLLPAEQNVSVSSCDDISDDQDISCGRDVNAERTDREILSAIEDNRNEWKHSGKASMGYDDDEDDGGDDDHRETLPVKCVFLTEADASCVGTFSRKKRDLMDAKAIDMQYSPKPDDHLDLAMMQWSDYRSQRGTRGTKTCGEKKKKTPTVDYQPLTMGALMEYATKYSVPGQGSFKHGARPMWVVQ